MSLPDNGTKLVVGGLYNIMQPAAQLAHDVCPAGAYVPVAQLPQIVAGLLSSSTVPAAQSMQASVPAAAYLPAAQASQPSLPPPVTTHLVSESVPTSVKSVVNVITAPLTPETVSEPTGAAVQVCPDADASRSTRSNYRGVPINQICCTHKLAEGLKPLASCLAEDTAVASAWMACAHDALRTRACLLDK